MIDRQLLLKALVRFVAGVVLVGLLVFVPAGTIRYPGGILLMGCLFLPMLVAGVVLLVCSPDLLRRRLSAREEQGEQRAVVAASGLLFVAAFVVAGLSFRFGWLTTPGSVQHGAATVFLFGYALYAEVMRENVYLSRTVEVQDGQRVIDTGLYGSVRHPMYLATLLMFLAMPLMLGSVASFALMLLYVPIIVARIRNEEQVLARGLPGYCEYQRRVRWHLIPFIW